MNPKPSKFILGAWIIALLSLLSFPLRAQVADATLAGTVTDPASKVVPNAKIFIKNVVTRQSVETQTDSAGLYKLSNLVPGDYEVSVSAEGFSTNTTKVMIAAGTKQTLNLTGWCAFTGGLGLFSSPDPGKCSGSGKAQQAVAYAKDPSADRSNRHGSVSRHRYPGSWRRRQEH
jgi:hypothetical protein